MARSSWLISDESEQSYLGSISDLMSGLLFVFIITVAAFALLLARAEEEQRDVVDRLRSTEETRNKLLRTLEKRLRDAGVEVVIDLDNGVLRLPEKVLFQSGYARLVPGGEQNLEQLASVLLDVLPSYLQDDPSEPKPLLEAVMIEGHTDIEPVGPLSPFDDNWDLSTARAIKTHQLLVGTDFGQPDLAELENHSGQSLLGVAGYSFSRPVTDGTTPEELARNRRIDLRFLMAPPQVESGRAGAASQAVDDTRDRLQRE